MAEQELISTEAELQSFYDTEKGGFSSLEDKEALLSLEKKEGNFYKPEKRNGDKKVELFGYTVGMRIQKNFKPMQKVERWQTQYGD
jgi:hypothetical protein